MKTRDMLGCVGWAAFFFLASTLIPFIGSFFGLLTPLPFLYYSAKLGLYQGVKLAAVATFTIYLIARLAGQPQVFLFCMEFSILGLALSEFFRKKLSLGQTIFLGTGFMLLLGLLVLFFIALSKNMGPLEMVLKYFQGQINASMNAYEGMGMPQEQAIEFKAFAKAFVETISKIYPSLLVIGTGFAVWLNVVIARPLFRMGKLEYPDFAPVDRWQAPDRMIWGVIVSGFALFLSSASIELLAINTLIVMAAIYFFHGLSITLFFLNKYHIPTWIRIGVYILIIAQQFLMAIVILAGLFDQWVDFRKIQKKSDS